MTSRALLVLGSFVLVSACSAGLITGENGGADAGFPGTGGVGAGPGTGVTTGAAGTGGAAGAAVLTGTGGTQGGTVATGLPCNIQAIFQTHCTTCHGTVPTGGAPMSLVTLANLTAPSFVDPSVTFAQRAFVRVQAVTGQMPPAPAPRLSAAEIQDLATWIASGYPAGTCTGGTTGAAGATGTTGAAGTTGTTGAAGATGTTGAAGTTGGAAGTTGTATGVPCDVQAVFQSHCTLCHNSPPTGGAPMPLLSYADLTAPSAVNSGMTYAQRAVTRMQDNAAPMPPVPGTRATTAEIQTVSSWIAAGYPMGTCGGTTGAGGAGGGTGGPPDPLSLPPVCTSNTRWTGGNEGSANMNPGLACISCHASQGGEDEDEAPIFGIAGTLYPTGHEPNLCNGVNGGTTGARVVIVDAANRTITLTPNAAGNFTYTGALTFPYHAKVTYQGRERIMTAAQSTGDCNSCHTQNGANGAPGRITLP